MKQLTDKQIKESVRYRKPTEDEIERHENLACCAETFIESIVKNCPPCADTTAAIRKVREAKMTASAAIALKGMI